MPGPTLSLIVVPRIREVPPSPAGWGGVAVVTGADLGLPPAVGFPAAPAIGGAHPIT